MHEVQGGKHGENSTGNTEDMVQVKFEGPDKNLKKFVDGIKLIENNTKWGEKQEKSLGVRVELKDWLNSQLREKNGMLPHWPHK